MPRVMLVEDDNNLREIYGARLQAEGYEIVPAKDGEEALALAVKEKPDLIICDIMMPKISGFDVLDILHSTPETKNTKVIMMTALSQTEDKAHADKLGADRYLVKSQVTLEDVVRVAKEVLEGAGQAAAPATDQPTAPAADPATAAATPPAASEPSSTATQPTDPAIPAIPPANDANTLAVDPVPATQAAAADSTPAVPVPPPPPDVPPSRPPAPQPGGPIPITIKDDSEANTPPSDNTSNEKVLADAVAKVSTQTPESSAQDTPAKDNLSDPDRPKSKVIQPLNDPSQVKTDIHELLAKEEANGNLDNAVGHAPADVVAPTNPAPDSQT